MDAVIEYAMQTPDGDWRVEVVKRGRTRWYRIIHQDNEVDWLSIAAVQRILGEADVDMADLVEATEQPPEPLSDPRHGAA
jgi:bifunctional non-homologous end joining protein LigD